MPKPSKQKGTREKQKEKKHKQLTTTA